MKINFVKKNDPNSFRGQTYDFGPEVRKGPTIRWVLILFLLVVATILPFYSYFNRLVYIEAKGIIAAPITKVKAKTSGHVIDCKVKRGDFVQEKQLLVRLRNRELETELARIKTLKNELGSLLHHDETTYDSQIANEKKEYLEKVLREKQIIHRNIELLYENGAATSTELNQSQLEILRIKTEIKKSELTISKLTDRGVNRYQNEILLRLNTIDMEAAKVKEKLGYQEYQATNSGKVLSVDAKEGDYVFVGDPLLSVTHGNEWSILAYVDNKFIQWITEGKKVFAFLENGESFPVVIEQDTMIVERLPEAYRPINPGLLHMFECHPLYNETQAHLPFGQVVTIRLGNRFSRWIDLVNKISEIPYETGARVLTMVGTSKN